MVNSFVYVSCSGNYYNEYNQLTNMLKENNKFNVVDLAEISHDGNRGNSFIERIRKAIFKSNVVLFIVGKSIVCDDTMKIEVDMAVEMGKPIIAVWAYGPGNDISYAESKANEIVSWDADSIVKAINRWL